MYQRNELQRFFWALTLVAWLVGACGPAQPKTVTIGIVSLIPEMEAIVTGYKASLAELGYVEGQNVVYVYAGATGAVDKLDPAAQKLADAKVDLILSLTTPGSQAVQRVISQTTIPQVFVAVTDPVAAGLVADLTHPGGRVTGVMAGAKASVSEGRRLEWLLKIAPDLRRLYVPYNPDDPVGVANYEAIRQTAAGVGLELVLHEVRNVEEANAAAADLPADIDAIFLPSDRVVGLANEAFIQAALEHQKPLAIANPAGVELGALMAYGPDFTAMGQQAARLTDQILKGTAPADLPVEVPELFLSINLRTAAAIQLTIPEDLVRQAYSVIR